MYSRKKSFSRPISETGMRGLKPIKEVSSHNYKEFIKSQPRDFDSQVEEIFAMEFASRYDRELQMSAALVRLTSLELIKFPPTASPANRIASSFSGQFVEFAAFFFCFKAQFEGVSQR